MKPLYFALFAILLACSLSFGQVPQLLSHQGYVADSVGAGITGTFPMTFRMFTDSIGGAPILSQSFPAVTLTKGVFNVNIDVSSVAFSVQYWLETELNSQTLAPRARLTSAPYSLGPWTTNGPALTYNAGNVTISQTLTVGGESIGYDGKLVVSSPYYGLEHTDGVATIGTYVAPTVATGLDGGWIGTKTEHSLHLFTGDSEPKMTLTMAGNVGIGTQTPDAKMHVAGNVKIADGTQGAGKVLTSDADGLASWQPAGSQIGFKANTNATQALADVAFTTIQFPDEEYDDGDNYNPATHEFTAPSTGLYHFDVNLILGGAGNAAYVQLFVDGSIKAGTLAHVAGVQTPICISVNLKLNAGNVVNLKCFALGGANSTIYTASPSSNFSGYKIY